jgi:hypothetical protein
MEKLINRSFAVCMNLWLIGSDKHNKIYRFEGKMCHMLGEQLSIKRLLIQSYHVPKKNLPLCAKKE